ncbi:hypothetical protein SESBI_12976 [Sesbania bispinosa]|nr:hypothetical protein SESBI_12976 [Sesbania bispinosa]
MAAPSCERLGSLVQTYGCPKTPNYPNHGGVAAPSCEAHDSHRKPISTPKASHQDLLRQLYVYCAYSHQKEYDHDEPVIKMFNCYLTRQDLISMKPRAWVCNTTE